MKKCKLCLSLFLLLSGPAFLYSCRNDFQCTCTDGQGKVTVTPIEKSSRVEAEIACESVTIAGETCVLD